MGAKNMKGNDVWTKQTKFSECLLVGEDQNEVMWLITVIYQEMKRIRAKDMSMQVIHTNICKGEERNVATNDG